MSHRLAGPGLALAAVALLTAAPARADFPEEFGALLAEARLAEAASLAEARIAAEPADGQALFALGAAQFLGAIEGLGQGLYRLGINNGEDSILAANLPFLRVPVPRNPAPEPVSYKALREVLSGFVDDLAEAEATLARVPADPVKLSVPLGAIRLDLNGDGQAGEGERLALVLATVSGARPVGEDFAAMFDESDVPWLRGYAHLLSAIAEIPLAHDWQATFDHTFHGVFPAADLPSSELQREFDMMRKDPRQAGDWLDTREIAGIADAIAFLHLWHWPVVEPERLSAARQHLLAMIDLSRESWRRIAAETDDDQEWLPGPHQTGLFPQMRVDERVVAEWHGFLDGFEAVLEGRLLLPHWRFRHDRGLNVMRMFEEPSTLDPVLLIQGSAALPYIEEGPVAAGSTMENAFALMDRGFLAYFVWFN
jgi:hypothetical protein